MSGHIQTKTALLFGATGLTGGYLLKILLNDSRYCNVKIGVRQPLKLSHPKLFEFVTDFNDNSALQANAVADDYFCCLGTTIKKARSKEAFRRVDLDIPILMANMATSVKAKKMLVISSLGADADSRNFYLQVKGQMEEAVSTAYDGSLYFFRPSLLLGERKQSRTGEQFAKIAMKALSWMMIGQLKKYRAVHAHTLARCMVEYANSEHRGGVIESDVIAGYSK